jgi:hypothetical protein
VSLTAEGQRRLDGSFTSLESERRRLSKILNDLDG